MIFKLWSDLNSEAKKVLKPDLGMRAWDDLSKEEKERIWRHLDVYFFDVSKTTQDRYHPAAEKESGLYYHFYGDNDDDKRKRINTAINAVTVFYKVNNYAKNFLKRYTHLAACEDFYSIFTNQKGDVVLELLSLYCKAILNEAHYVSPKMQNESESLFKKRKEDIEWTEFNDFARTLNDVFSDFGVNVHLTKNGFVPKQEDKITKEVYVPVLSYFSNEKWKEVNTILADAFSEYRKNTELGFSNCVTNTVSAVQAYLQIVVNGKTGSGDIGKLIVQAQTKNLIPDDSFTKELFKKIEEILMRERQATSIAHPKKEYATQRNALMVLNLAMVFFTHCIVQ